MQSGSVWEREAAAEETDITAAATCTFAREGIRGEAPERSSIPE